MSREVICTGLFAITLGVVLTICFGRHGTFFGVGIVAVGVIVTLSGIFKP